MEEKRIILPDNHIFLSSSDDIDNILSPLKKIGILYFTFMRNYSDGTQLYLSNHGAWVRAYYDLQLYKTSQFQLSPETYQSGKIIWPVQSDLPVYQYARENLKSDHGITIIKKRDQYTEFYFFSTSVNNYNIMNIYLNHSDMLDKFILYFRDKCEKLITKAEQQKILLPKNIYNTNESNIEIDQSFGEIIQDVKQEMTLRKYRINNPSYHNVKLSSRELECILLYSHGKTAKETARELNLSQRTVEGYIENIKTKLNCSSKNQALKILLNEGFF